MWTQVPLTRVRCVTVVQLAEPAVRRGRGGRLERAARAAHPAQHRQDARRRE